MTTLFSGKNPRPIKSHLLCVITVGKRYGALSDLLRSAQIRHSTSRNSTRYGSPCFAFEKSAINSFTSRQRSPSRLSSAITGLRRYGSRRSARARVFRSRCAASSKTRITGSCKRRPAMLKSKTAMSLRWWQNWKRSERIQRRSARSAAVLRKKRARASSPPPQRPCERLKTFSTLSRSPAYLRDWRRKSARPFL